MGCGASAPVSVTDTGEGGGAGGGYLKPAAAKNDVDGDLHIDLSHAERAANAMAGHDRQSFVGSVLAARATCPDDAVVIEKCCSGLKGHNQKLKALIATADAEAVYEAMNGGFLGLGCNHRKLIAVLCSRTKAQLEHTRKRYRALYDRDLRDDVASDTGGYYGKMISHALLSRSEYVAEVIHEACNASIWDLGCNEMMLVDLFVLCDQEWIRAGKKQWEGRHDASLVDYLKKKLGSSYSGLFKLLMMLLNGDIANENEPVDETKAAEQAAALHAELSKGTFSSAEEEVMVDIIGANHQAQNAKVSEAYEKAYSESIGKGIRAKFGEKLAACLCGLLMPRSDYIAMRLEEAMSGWTTSKGRLERLLGGLDGSRMDGVVAAFERKYGKPLSSALHEKLSDGNFHRGAITWIETLDNPSRGVEELTSVEIPSGDAVAMCQLCDYLLLENEMLMRFVCALDVETIREAVKGWSTDDTALIRTLATRSKRFLGRISYSYREAFGEALRELVDSELGGEGWYAYLAKFLVLQPSQSDALLLDLAMAGRGSDHNALIEFLCARHPRRVRAAKKAWEGLNDASLVDRLSDELSGDLRTIALTMLKGKRTSMEVDEELADTAEAERSAEILHDNMSSAIEILCSHSPAQNAAIATAYENKYDESLGRGLGQEFSGNVKAALSALLLEPAQWYASRLRASFKGMGTSDRTVCRIVGAHDKDEIRAIAAAYDAKYGRRLKDDIADECSGDYKRLAVGWIDLPDQLEQPQETIALPTAQEVPSTKRGHRASDGCDEDEDEELLEEPPDPSSPLFKAKIVMWTKLLAEAEANGRERKVAHYRRLLVMYPADADFEEAGSSKADFDEWQNTNEDLFRRKLISLAELKLAWGVDKPPITLPTPQPVSYPSVQQPQQVVLMQQQAMAQQAMMQQQAVQQRMAVHQQQQTQYPVLMQPQTPGVTQMRATVPMGVYGGQSIMINTVAGPMTVMVPPGYGPGSVFTFNVPAAGRAPQPQGGMMTPFMNFS